MTKMQKNELYDEMCHILTDYENEGDATLPVSKEDLYNMLVKIQNNWEELTGEDE